MQAIFFGGLVPPNNFTQIVTCIGVGLLGYGAQITLTLGLRSAKAAPAIATSYLSVVWGILASLFIFHEVCPLPKAETCWARMAVSSERVNALTQILYLTGREIWQL